MAKKIEFTIDLETKTILVHGAPFRMALTELKELKNQLNELLVKGYISP